MAFKKCSWWFVLLVVFGVEQCSAQEEESCYSAGSIAASVILTFLFTILLLVGLVFAWKKYKGKKEHLILETDPEKGKGGFAFDNPGFKDSSLLAIPKAVEKNQKFETKPKWNQWSPLNALTMKNEKRKTLDDSAIEGNEVKVVALRSHDFTGLGFNIEGNMKEGIYIKDILHRGPAFESGKLNPGDRINSVTISFEHMVYEDALTILSYASPYEVIIEAKSGKLIHHTTGQGAQPSHPVYRSSSCTDLFQMEKSSKKRLFGDDYTGSLSSNYSSLQKSRSNMTTLERKESKSPKMRGKKVPSRHLSPGQLKAQLEQRISSDHQNNLKHNQKLQKIEAETQKTENKHHKFGIRVLPVELQQKSPKAAESSQNDNNLNMEKYPTEIPYQGIDEVDEMKKIAPQARKREKKLEVTPERNEEAFIRQGSLGGSGIKRDINGIPQEIPSHMLNAAVAARRNRKSSVDNGIDKEDDEKTPKKSKGKAPAPPPTEERSPSKNSFDEIHSLQDDIEMTIKKLDGSPKNSEKSLDLSMNDNNNEYNSDSDIETDNHSSVNTIELNASDITIHQTEDEGRENRKTASTGDLTKIQKTRNSGSGTLERAQSLDITDTGITGSLKRKAGKIEDSFDMNSDQDLFGKVLVNKEPRLSLYLDGLNTFQRNRLKKSTEWGNLEDAILKLNQEDEKVKEDPPTPERLVFKFGEKTPEFDALVHKIKEIKRESLEIDLPPEVIEKYNTVAYESKMSTEKRITNQIWPFETEVKQYSNGTTHVFEKSPENKSKHITENKIEATNGDIPQDKTSQNSVTENLKTTNGTDHIETKSGFERRQQYRPEPENNVMRYPPEEQECLESSTIPIISEKRQIKPSKLLDEVHTETSLQQTVPESTLKSSEEDTVISEHSDVIVLDTLEDTPMPSELLETVTVLPPEKHKRQRQPAEHISKSTVVLNKPEEVTVLNSNNTDETKTVVTFNSRDKFIPNVMDITQNFLFTEQMSCSQDDITYNIKPEYTNISDDIKVSRHSHGSLERPKTEVTIPKSDDAKSVDLTLDSAKNISNIEVNNGLKENGDSALHSLELSINEKSDLYTTALDTTNINDQTSDAKIDSSTITISTPDLIKNATLTEAINTLNKDITIRGPTSLTVEIPRQIVEVTESTFSKVTTDPNKTLSVSNNDDSKSSSDSKNSTLTYVTEIQVITPNNTNSNISEIEILQNPPETNGRNLDNEFENYVKNFESRIETVETNIPNFESNMEEFINNEPKSIIINEKIDPEKELHKIQEIAEEQLKKLPEMRFTTSSYESKIPEKRQSQIELLRSNFEKNQPKLNKSDSIPKSRIPIATTAKTPPMSPERRDSRNLDMENDKAILELMSSSVHSTPLASHSKYQIKSPSKNVTVTSIRSNSKIPSGLPTFTSSRPPIPPKKNETSEGDNTVQISTNGNIESSFKQWVFNPSNNNAVTNIVVRESKEK